jgi:hypothetical protein
MVPARADRSPDTFTLVHRDGRAKRADPDAHDPDMLARHLERLCRVGERVERRVVCAVAAHRRGRSAQL